MADTPFVQAYHQVTGEARDIPEHWLGEGSPFPGRWGTTAPEGTEHARPRTSARRQAWVDYVVREGHLSAEDAEGYSKAELINTYGQEG